MWVNNRLLRSCYYFLFYFPIDLSILWILEFICVPPKLFEYILVSLKSILDPQTSHFIIFYIVYMLNGWICMNKYKHHFCKFLKTFTTLVHRKNTFYIGMKNTNIESLSASTHLSETKELKISAHPHPRHCSLIFLFYFILKKGLSMNYINFINHKWFVTCSLKILICGIKRKYNP